MKSRIYKLRFGTFPKIKSCFSFRAAQDDTYTCFRKQQEKNVGDKNVQKCAFAGLRLCFTRGTLELYGKVEEAGELQKKVSFN